MSSPPDEPLPAWALAKAEAALTVGQTMPEIETSLVAKRLSREEATAVVMAVLEGRVRASLPPEPSHASVLANRIAIILVAVALLSLEYAYQGRKSAGRMAPVVILLVGWIWFGGAIQRACINANRAERAFPWRYPGFGWISGLCQGALRSTEGDEIVLMEYLRWIPWIYVGVIAVTQVVFLIY